MNVGRSRRFSMSAVDNLKTLPPDQEINREKESFPSAGNRSAVKTPWYFPGSAMPCIRNTAQQTGISRIRDSRLPNGSHWHPMPCGSVFIHGLYLICEDIWQAVHSPAISNICRTEICDNDRKLPIDIPGRDLSSGEESGVHKQGG